MSSLPEWNSDPDTPLTDEEIKAYESSLRESATAGNAMAILLFRSLARLHELRARNLVLGFRVEHRDTQVPHLIERAEAFEKVLNQISDPSYIGNFDEPEIIEIYRQWSLDVVKREDERANLLARAPRHDEEQS